MTPEASESRAASCGRLLENMYERFTEQKPDRMLDYASCRAAVRAGIAAGLVKLPPPTAMNIDSMISRIQHEKSEEARKRRIEEAAVAAVASASAAIPYRPPQSCVSTLSPMQQAVNEIRAMKEIFYGDQARIARKYNLNPKLLNSRLRDMNFAKPKKAALKFSGPMGGRASPNRQAS